MLQRVTLELTVCDYDRIGTSDPIGRVSLGYNRKGQELKHWKEMVENPRRPVIHWHVLQVLFLTHSCIFFSSISLTSLPLLLLLPSTASNLHHGTLCDAPIGMVDEHTQHPPDDHFLFCGTGIITGT